MNGLKFHPGPMRPSFLVLTPACALLGLGTAVWTSDGINAVHTILAFAGALAAHISVNAFNEYFDFKSGLDLNTRRTPFSGGSGTLPADPDKAGGALATAAIALAVVAGVGIYFFLIRGWMLLPLGAVGMLTVVAYTPWLTRFRFLCLIAPGLGFGTLMVMGTDFVLTGSYTRTAFVASCVPFFLVNDLLLLNQFPDVEADRAVGRRHLPIVIGRRASSIVYGVFLLLAYATIVAGVTADLLPQASLLALATILLAVPAAVGAWKYADDVEKLGPAMAINVGINVLTPVLVAVGLLMS
jgi:1,4-dihydroxy-2-naphthoate octaprenyltransferase